MSISTNNLEQMNLNLSIDPILHVVIQYQVQIINLILIYNV